VAGPASLRVFKAHGVCPLKAEGHDRQDSGHEADRPVAHRVEDALPLPSEAETTEQTSTTAT